MNNSDFDEIVKIMRLQNDFIGAFNDYSDHRNFLFTHLKDPESLPAKVNVKSDERHYLNFFENEDIPESPLTRQILIDRLVELRELYQKLESELGSFDDTALFKEEALAESMKEATDVIKKHTTPFTPEQIEAATVNGVVYYDLLEKQMKN